MAVQVHAQLAYVALQHCCAILMLCLAPHAVVYVGSSLWLIAAGNDHLSFVGPCQCVCCVLLLGVVCLGAAVGGGSCANLAWLCV